MDIEIKHEPSLTIVENHELAEIDGPDQLKSCDQNSDTYGYAYHDNSSINTNDSNSYNGLSTLLKEWGIYPLYERFVENLIDVDVLEYMIEDDIKDLCKDFPMRYRMILRHKLKQKDYKNNVTIENLSKSSSNQKRVHAVSENISTKQQKCSSPKPHFSNTTVKATEKESITSDSNDSNKSKDYSQYLRGRLSLLKILECSELGRKFLEQYKIENGKRIYSAESRKYIKKALIDHYFRQGQGHISAQDFNEMVALIVDELPDEEPTVWYSPPTADSTSSTGILYGRYRYVCQINKQYRKQKETKTVHHSTMLVQQAKDFWEGLSSKEQNACIVTKSNLANLANTDVNSDEIFKAWKTCYPLRRYEIVTGVLQLNEIQPFTKFSRIHDLITYDFCRILSITNEVFHNRVPLFLERFKTVYSSYKLLIEDDRVLTAGILTTFAKDGYELSDKAAFLAFYSLPYMLPQSFGKKAKKRRKYAFTEVRDSFITLLPAQSMLEECIETRWRYCLEYEMQNTPFIVGIGTLTNGVHDYYVVVEKLMFPCTTVVQAVDLLMKLYTVLHIEYANACESVLRFIQGYLYELKFEGERNNSLSTALITDFNRL